MKLSNHIAQLAELLGILREKGTLPADTLAKTNVLIDFARRYQGTLCENPGFAVSFAASTTELLTNFVQNPDTQWTFYLHPSIAVLCAEIVAIVTPNELDVTPNREFVSNRPKPEKEDIN